MKSTHDRIRIALAVAVLPLLGSVLLSSVQAATISINSSSSSSSEPEYCPRAKEFITALEYIRARNDLSIVDKDAQTVAMQVADGCTDAAKRFIKVSSLLLQSGIVGREAVDTAIDFAKKTNSDTEAFMTVFKRAYAEDQLDLDTRSSFTLAQTLYKHFQNSLDGDLEQARKDFDVLVDFCIHQKTLNLPRPQCADFAVRIAKLAPALANGKHQSIAKPFRELYDFLVSPKGPNIIAGQALKTAEEVVAKGAGATENFIQAYRYAVSAKGLNLELNGAMKFASQMATPPAGIKK